MSDPIDRSAAFPPLEPASGDPPIRRRGFGPWRNRRRRPGVRKIAILPTLFTLGNAVCGFGALTYASKVTVTTEIAPVQAAEWLALAGWLIFLAMVFDAFDGGVARLAKTTSDFGGQLDSMCDVISFGVAPGFLVLKLSAGFPRPALWVIATFYVVCAAMRLARFNVENTHSEASHLSFSGLPSPAAAGAIAALGIMTTGMSGPAFQHWPGLVRMLQQSVLYGLPFGTLALALLMVSRVRYPHVVNQFLKGRHPFGHLIRLVLAAVAVMLIRELAFPFFLELALPFLLWVFAVWGPFRAAWEVVVLNRPSEEPLF